MAHASEFVGTWRAVSWHRRTVATGQMDGMDLGPAREGFISYGTDGRMSVVLVKRDRPPPATAMPTDSEKLRLFDSMTANAGTYRVNKDHLVHHIDVASNQSWVETDQVRYFKMEGDLLTLTSASFRDPETNDEHEYVATWRRHRAND